MKRFSFILMIVSMLVIGVGVINAQDEANRSGARGGIIREVLQATSAETGLAVNNIITAMQADGAILADVIEANGGSVDAVVTVAVESATERINQAVTDGNVTQERADMILANLEQLVTDGINGELPVQNGENPRERVGRALFNVVSETTGLDAQSIIQDVRGGKTLADVITENGGSVDAVVASVVATATERINQGVANERITQEQADELLANLEPTFTDIINSEFERPNGGGERDGRNAVIGVLRKIAEETGLTAQDIIPLLRDGTTPAEILTDNGVDVDTFVNDLLVNTQDRLNDAVESGRLTQEQADERLETIRTTLTDRLNNPFEGRGMMESGN